MADQSDSHSDVPASKKLAKKVVKKTEKKLTKKKLSKTTKVAKKVSDVSEKDSKVSKASKVVKKIAKKVTKKIIARSSSSEEKPSESESKPSTPAPEIARPRKVFKRPSKEKGEEGQGSLESRMKPQKISFADTNKEIGPISQGERSPKVAKSETNESGVRADNHQGAKEKSKETPIAKATPKSKEENSDQGARNFKNSRGGKNFRNNRYQKNGKNNGGRPYQGPSNNSQGRDKGEYRKDPKKEKKVDKPFNPNRSYPVEPNQFEAWEGEVLNAAARVMIGFRGIDLSSPMRALLETYPVAGVIIFSTNFDNPAQLAELINDIQEIGMEKWGRPFIVATDHEGTTVTRFKAPFTIFPDADAFGRHNSRTLMYEGAQIMTRELKSVGINMNFAPVADLNTNKKNPVIGKRAYGGDLEVVNKMVHSYIRSCEKNKLITCAKHFPGHGDTSVDSHEALPVISYELSELEKREFIPFQKALQAGVPSVMLAHLQLPKITEDISSQSSLLVNYLREKWKYTGLILTDDMEMGAVSGNQDPLEASQKSLQAGVDLLLFHKESTALEIIPQIANLLLDQESHRKSLERIRYFVRRYIEPYSPVYIPDVTKVFHRDHSMILRAIQDGSGKTLKEWKKIRELPPSRRPKQHKEMYNTYLYEEYQDYSVALTAPGGKLNDEQSALQNLPRKPHKEALSVTSEAYVRSQLERMQSIENNGNQSRNSGKLGGKNRGKSKQRSRY